MAFKIHHAAILLSAVTLLQCVAAMPALKSFKITQKVVYDCIGMYEQPSLKNPLLKNHTLQLKPSSSSSSRPSTRSVEKKKRNTVNCPAGTVPILRKSEEEKAVVDVFVRSRSNPTTAETPVEHMAAISSQPKVGMHTGIRASISVHNLTVAKDEVTSALIYLDTSANGFVFAGWMYDWSLFGDSRPWTFGYWSGDNGTGCINILCSGFVQVSSLNPLSEPIDIISNQTFLDISIRKDAVTGNWWVQNYIGDIVTDVGYWPKELFGEMDKGGDMAAFGGVVVSSQTGSSPPMGSGEFPKGKEIGETGSFVRMQLAADDGDLIKASNFSLKELSDSSTCYQVEYRGDRGGKLGDVLAYGGPGGNSCGVSIE